MIVRQGRMMLDRGQRFQPRGRTLPSRDGNRAVQRHYGRRVDRVKLVVEMDDERPVRGAEIGRRGVGRGDTGLHVILAHPVARGAAVQADQSFRNPCAVPQRAVLVGQQEQVALRVQPRRRARRLQQAERQVVRRPPARAPVSWSATSRASRMASSARSAALRV